MTVPGGTGRGPAPSSGRPGDWLAMHIFYASDPYPLLMECIRPLVRDLRDSHLIRRYFFIRYWLEGPHVRLRLRLTRASDRSRVHDLVRTAVGDFLIRRPALYDADPDQLADTYRQMYLAEYSPQRWETEYGPRGMPFQPNNSVRSYSYEPEYDRYGGAAGVELAEWHFEKSSDMVLDLLGSTNAHIRTVAFGLSAQLAAIMVSTFLTDPPAAAAYLDGYRSYWESTYLPADPDRHDRWDATYRLMADGLRERISPIVRATTTGSLGNLSSFAQTWALHCAELRSRILTLEAAGRLVFPGRRTATASRPGSSSTTLEVLSHSHVHMTNNRLGVTVSDEAYLAYLVRRTIEDGMTMPAPATAARR